MQELLVMGFSLYFDEKKKEKKGGSLKVLIEARYDGNARKLISKVTGFVLVFEKATICLRFMMFHTLDIWNYH